MLCIGAFQPVKKGQRPFLTSCYLHIGHRPAGESLRACGYAFGTRFPFYPLGRDFTVTVV